MERGQRRKQASFNLGRTAFQRSVYISHGSGPGTGDGQGSIQSRACSRAWSAKDRRPFRAVSGSARTRGQEQEDQPKKEGDKEVKPGSRPRWRVQDIAARQFKEMTVTNRRPQANTIILRRSVKRPSSGLGWGNKKCYTPGKREFALANPSAKSCGPSLWRRVRKTVRYRYQALILDEERWAASW